AVQLNQAWLEALGAPVLQVGLDRLDVAFVIVHVGVGGLRAVRRRIHASAPGAEDDTADIARSTEGREALSRGRCLHDLEEQALSLRFRRTRPGGTHPVESRERPRPLAFHLRTALLRTRWKYALSGRDGRSAQDGLRAAGAANPHRKRHCGLARVLRRI